MNATDAFLKDWESNSSVSEKNDKIRTNGNLEIKLSKSGRENTIRLNYLKSTKPKNGEATKFMKWLTKQADKHQVTLTLCAQPVGYSWNKDELPNKDKLKQWTERLGFKVKFQYPDSEGYEMVREPRQKKK